MITKQAWEDYLYGESTNHPNPALKTAIAATYGGFSFPQLANFGREPFDIKGSMLGWTSPYYAIAPLSMTVIGRQSDPTSGPFEIVINYAMIVIASGTRLSYIRSPYQYSDHIAIGRNGRPISGRRMMLSFNQTFSGGALPGPGEVYTVEDQSALRVAGNVSTATKIEGVTDISPSEGADFRARFKSVIERGTGPTGVNTRKCIRNLTTAECANVLAGLDAAGAIPVETGRVGGRSAFPVAPTDIGTPDHRFFSSVNGNGDVTLNREVTGTESEIESAFLSSVRSSGAVVTDLIATNSWGRSSLFQVNPILPIPLMADITGVIGCGWIVPLHVVCSPPGVGLNVGLDPIASSFVLTARVAGDRPYTVDVARAVLPLNVDKPAPDNDLSTWDVGDVE